MTLMKNLFHPDFLEIRRQFLHLLIGLSICFLIVTNLFNVLFFSIILLISILLSYISKKKNIPGLTFFIKYFDRPIDSKIFPGKGFITFLIGSICSVIIFDYLIGNKFAAFIGVLSLTIGDSMSTIYGHSFGKIKNPFNKTKTIEGMVFSLLFLSFTLCLVLPWYYAIFVGTVSAFIETIEIKIAGKILDDNIYLPLIIGAVTLLLTFI